MVMLLQISHLLGASMDLSQVIQARQLPIRVGIIILLTLQPPTTTVSGFSITALLAVIALRQKIMYSIVQPKRNATITPKTVLLAVAPKVYDASTDMMGYVSITTGVGGETLTYNGATSNDAHVATAGKYLDAITLGNASDGSGGLPPTISFLRSMLPMRLFLSLPRLYL